MLSTISFAIIWPLTVVRTALAIGLVWIASSLPIIQDKVKRYNEKYFLVPYEDFWQSWCSWNMLRIVVNQELTELKKTARLGLPAPNCKLVSTDGKEKRLLDFARGNRPLVLNFGSCSWPPFFIRLQNDFTKVVREFGDVADFLVVYISEAHPSDGWRWNVSDLKLNSLRITWREIVNKVISTDQSHGMSTEPIKFTWIRSQTEDIM